MVTVSPLKRARLQDPRQPSQEDVARSVNITQSFYAMLEAGDRAASTELANALAAYFKVDIEAIFSPTRYSSEPTTAKA